MDSLRFEVPSQEVYTNMPWNKKNKDYAAMITRMDRGIGKIMDHLSELDLNSSTIIFFTSDNGPMKDATTEFFNSNGPLRGEKRDLYEGGIREPLVVKWDGHIIPGSISDHLGGFWDVLPTLLDLAGHSIPDNIDGVSFAPTLTGLGNQENHPHLYWEFHEGTGAQAVRQGKWKAVKLNSKQDLGYPLELYDLSVDLGENKNVASDHPEKVNELEGLMQSSRTSSEHFPLAVDNTN